MDTPTLGCRFPQLFNVDSEMPSAHKPPILRVSQSDPHLDIPHFVSVQDKALGFHPTLTGLLENAVHFNVGTSSDRLDVMDTLENPRKKSLDRNKSAVELCSSSTETVPQRKPSLRKSSTVANYQLDPAASEAQSAGGLFSSFSSRQVAKPEEGGLTMSVKSSPFSAGASASSAGLHPAPEASADAAATGTLGRVKSGMMGVFSRGFFGKPVMCNQEENYRYIMALDRS